MARQLSLGEEKLFQQVNHLEFLNKAWLAHNVVWNQTGEATFVLNSEGLPNH
jgi:hypothetical protein